jgi:hypothetical protein
MILPPEGPQYCEACGSPFDVLVVGNVIEYDGHHVCQLCWMAHENAPHCAACNHWPTTQAKAPYQGIGCVGVVVLWIGFCLGMASLVGGTGGGVIGVGALFLIAIGWSRYTTGWYRCSKCNAHFKRAEIA